MAIGPALNLDGPLPVAPEYRLLSLPGVVQAADRELNGVNIWGYPEETPSLWEPCSAGTYRDKESDSNWSQPRFDAFVAYLPISCSTITAAPEVFAMRAEAVLNATISFAVEQALAQGVVGSSNPYFGDTALTQLGGAAVLPQAGLNYLENAIGATGRQGIIHASPGTVSAWNFVNLVTDNGEGYIETANGTPVVSGGGYINTDPVGKAGSDPSVGQEWAFATGPVKVFMAAPEVMQVSDYVDREINLITYRAEQEVVATWDTALQSGCLIDWTP